MQRKDYVAGVALPDDLKGNLEKIAKAYGMSLSKLFRVSVLFYAGLSMDFKDSMQRIADNLHVLPTFVIERLALAHLAEMAADEEIAGQPIPKAIMELAPGLSSQQFYDAWKAQKVKQLRN
jgi:predicted transcriptional regulator